MESKNVLMPVSVMTQIVHLLYNIDMSSYDVILQAEYYIILNFFTKKQHTLDLRRAYADLIQVQDCDDARHEARVRYYQEKYKI